MKILIQLYHTAKIWQGISPSCACQNHKSTYFYSFQINHLLLAALVQILDYYLQANLQGLISTKEAETSFQISL